MHVANDKLITRVVVPAQSGKGVLLRRGQRLKVIAERGPQVGDLFAFVQDDLAETRSPSPNGSCSSSV